MIAAQAAYVAWRDGALIPAVDAGDLAGARAAYLRLADEVAEALGWAA